jgi:DNA-binding XRE family transcriptional regulator
MSFLDAGASRAFCAVVGVVRKLTKKGDLRPEQVGAARALLGWSQSDLARAAGLGRSTITAFETSSRPPFDSVRNAIRHALEEAGVAFVFGSNGSFGVVVVGVKR